MLPTSRSTLARRHGVLITLLATALLPHLAADAAAQVSPLQDAALVAAPGSPAAGDHPGIDWYADGYNRALRAARDGGRLVFIAFVPAWSDYSNKVVDETFADAAVARELEGMVCLQYRDDDVRATQVMKLFNVTTFPTLIVVGSDGRIEDAIFGYIPPAPLVFELQRIKSGNDTVSARQALADASPGDLALRHSLAVKLGDCGDTRRAQRALDSIRRDDPDGATLTGARVKLQDVLQAIAAEQGGTGNIANWDLTAFEAALGGIELPQARYEGWGQAGDLYFGAGRPEQALAAYRTQWAHVPESGLLASGLELVRRMTENAAAASAGQNAFVLEVAEEVVARAESLEGDAAALAAADVTEADYPSWLAEHLDALAFAYDAVGRTDEAIALAGRCLALDPENEEYQRRGDFFAAGRTDG